jgi:hypothetical protein
MKELKMCRPVILAGSSVTENQKIGPYDLTQLIQVKGAAATNVGIFIYIWDKSAVSGTILYNTTIVTLPCRDAPCQQTKFLHD